MNKAILKIGYIIDFIKETREYYHDGVDRELIDMLKDLKKLLLDTRA